MKQKKELIREVFNMLNETSEQGFYARVKSAKYSKKEINSIVKKLISEGFVEIVLIPSGDKEIKWYVHTGKDKSTALEKWLRWFKEEKKLK